MLFPAAAAMRGRMVGIPVSAARIREALGVTPCTSDEVWP